MENPSHRVKLSKLVGSWDKNTSLSTRSMSLGKSSGLEGPPEVICGIKARPHSSNEA